MVCSTGRRPHQSLVSKACSQVTPPARSNCSPACTLATTVCSTGRRPHRSLVWKACSPVTPPVRNCSRACTLATPVYRTGRRRCQRCSPVTSPSRNCSPACTLGMLACTPDTWRRLANHWMLYSWGTLHATTKT
jgi:hypothetical protein